MNNPNQRGAQPSGPAAVDPLAVSAAVASAFGVLDPETLELEESPRHTSPEDE